MNQSITETDRYISVIHGIAPEFMPRIAYRREKHFKTENKKIIKCPYCRNTFTTIDKTIKVEIYRLSAKAKVVYHESIPCQTCHNKVGIIFSTA